MLSASPPISASSTPLDEGEVGLVGELGELGRAGRAGRAGPPYSILTRNIEHDVLPACEQYGIYGMGVIPYSPLAGGWLSGRYRKNAETETEGPHSSARPQNRFDMSDPANQRKLDAAHQLAELADEADITLIEMALAFVLRHPAGTSAIIGPRTMDHLESQLGAADSSCPTRC